MSFDPYQLPKSMLCRSQVDHPSILLSVVLGALAAWLMIFVDWVIVPEIVFWITTGTILVATLYTDTATTEQLVWDLVISFSFVFLLMGWCIRWRRLYPKLVLLIMGVSAILYLLNDLQMEIAGWYDILSLVKYLIAAVMASLTLRGRWRATLTLLKLGK